LVLIDVLGTLRIVLDELPVLVLDCPKAVRLVQKENAKVTGANNKILRLLIHRVMTTVSPSRKANIPPLPLSVSLAMRIGVSRRTPRNPSALPFSHAE
jgi:hypothetical protein